MSKQAGVVQLYTIDGQVSHAELAATHNVPVSIDLNDEFDVQQQLDGSGEIIGLFAHNRRLTATVEVIVRADPATNTIANAKTNTKLPLDMLSIVTIAGTGLAFLDGTWNYMSGSFVASNGQDKHRLRLNLWAQPNPAANNAPVALALAS